MTDPVSAQDQAALPYEPLAFPPTRDPSPLNSIAQNETLLPPTPEQPPSTTSIPTLTEKTIAPLPPSQQLQSQHNQKDLEAKSDVEQASPPHILKQQSRLSTLSLQLAQLTEELTQARRSLRKPDADATIARHIKLLHEYNDVRDAGLKLMDIVAERRGVRVAEVMAEFEVGERD
ncbi:MAG: hypothetical protein GOMPHAMPRED_007562 [Gomphillus americanus]|uniref:Swi5-domain-containing protein n=1 Tax=Gomphillus americanus TaxID=1940652 RepID=A0A8H3ET21_9LECA|nr:MAG: hypothetical protein GOMPHAMPRED_007562 [Gomphillus americanus]